MLRFVIEGAVLEIAAMVTVLFDQDGVPFRPNASIGVTVAFHLSLMNVSM